MRYWFGLLLTILGFGLIGWDYFLMARDFSMSHTFLMWLIDRHGVETAVIMWVIPFFGGLFFLITAVINKK